MSRQRRGTARRGRTMKRNGRGRLPCAGAAAGRDKAAKAAARAARPGALSLSARSPRGAARAGAPPASRRTARRARGSLPYREHHEERDEGAEDEREIAADGEELERVQPAGDKADHARNRRIQYV